MGGVRKRSQLKQKKIKLGTKLPQNQRTNDGKEGFKNVQKRRRILREQKQIEMEVCGDSRIYRKKRNQKKLKTKHKRTTKGYQNKIQKNPPKKKKKKKKKKS